jgi:hypothetical protein
LRSVVFEAIDDILDPIGRDRVVVDVERCGLCREATHSRRTISRVRRYG